MSVNMQDMFADQQIDIKCDCGKFFQVPFTVLEKDGAEVVCPHCKTNQIIYHDETTKKTFADSEKELKEFNKMAKKLGLK